MAHLIDLDALEAAVSGQLGLFDQPDVRRPLEDYRWRGNGGRTTAELVAEHGAPVPSMPVQLCNGMGVDTAAIITEMIENPEARVLLVTDDDGRQRLVRVDLADVTVVTAMTGNEYDETRAAMEDHLLPLMRKAGMRYVQIARGGQSQEDGVDILDDSRSTQRMFMRGAWALEDELVGAGTVPQTAAASRRCSARAKGWPLDVWAEWEYADTERIHVIGFAAEEDKRVAKDQSYSAVTRRSVYPLRQWGWDRAYCLDYLWERFGIEWPRSCCTYCPFAGGSQVKNARIARRWFREPDGGALALWLETMALALNPRMALFKTTTARAIAEQHGLTEVLARAEARLDGAEWAIYDIRRVHRPHGAKKDVEGDPARKGKSWRSVRAVRRGSRGAMTAALAGVKAGVYEHGITPRLHLVAAQDRYPTCERFLVAAPVGVDDKEQDGFAALWASTLAAQGRAGQLTERRVA